MASFTGFPGEVSEGVLGRLAKHGWTVLLMAGIAAIALGICVLVWPGATLLVVGVLFGIYLLVYGVFQLAGAFGSHVPGGMRVLHFVTGALCVLLGLLCFRGEAQSLLLLALWIGFGWLIRGIMLIVVAASTKGLPARGWQLFLGVVTCLAGVVLIVSPFGSLAVLTLVAGIWLVILGVVEVVHAVQLRSLAARHTGGVHEDRASATGG
ncbi:HdeD family acid-resistance protein [Streptomyces sp. NPDC094034]|uniref:HdeD family acid-resistance protein n=1 Tax=Streptomyces sp. NPDC094034 TaxID=3155309 RepID=UPI0033179DC8